MNAKKIATALLILFVVASVGTIVAKEMGAMVPTATSAPQTAGAIPIAPAAPQAAQQPAQPVAVQKQSETSAPAKVVAYYFHGNYRCPTCRKIEALTTEAIQTRFADDLKNGRVELKVINIEESANEHYVQDYQLASRSVVVARYEGGNQKDWKRLDAVWQLTGDKEAFIRLVQDETTALLKGKSE